MLCRLAQEIAAVIPFQFIDICGPSDGEESYFLVYLLEVCLGDAARSIDE